MGPPKPSRIEVAYTSANSQIRIRINNDRALIPPDHREKIFQRSYSAKKGEGKGLALAIARKIAKAHGWELSLEDSPETTFRIDIPI